LQERFLGAAPLLAGGHNDKLGKVLVHRAIYAENLILRFGFDPWLFQIFSVFTKRIVVIAEQNRYNDPDFRGITILIMFFIIPYCHPVNQY
jgi:hypothetical protein